MFVGLSEARKQKLKYHYRLFYHYLAEGWTPSYARGLAKINQYNDSLLKLIFDDYREIFKQKHTQNSGRRAWHSYG